MKIIELLDLELAERRQLIIKSAFMRRMIWTFGLTQPGRPSPMTGTHDPVPTPVVDWINKAYTYDADHKHAVTAVDVTLENTETVENDYEYDANGSGFCTPERSERGNMTCRIENGQTFLQSYNAENRMSGVALVTGDCDSIEAPSKTWLSTYDGEGIRVKQVYTEETSTLTNYAKHPVSEASKGYFAGGSYEIEVTGTTETVRQYYAIAGVTVGMREDDAFSYFLTDHLGSIVAVTDTDGAIIDGSETRYLPFGEVRTDVGTITQTDFGYTNQKNLPAMGLMDYRARMYDSYLNRFVQPDSIIPGAGNPQALNRYSYTTNNPVKYIDPSGHKACSDVDDEGNCIEDDYKPIPKPLPSNQKTIGGISISTERDQRLLSELEKGGAIPDLSDWLLTTLETNANSSTAKGILNANKQLNWGSSVAAWKEMVGYGQTWDYKVELDTYNIKDIKLGDNVVSSDYLANIAYGYVGRASGFSAIVLHTGAGGYAIIHEYEKQNTLTNLFNYWYLGGDEPRDFRSVGIGIWLYENQGKGNLTTDLLNQSFGAVPLIGGSK